MRGIKMSVAIKEYFEIERQCAMTMTSYDNQKWYGHEKVGLIIIIETIADTKKDIPLPNVSHYLNIIIL